MSVFVLCPWVGSIYGDSGGVPFWTPVAFDAVVFAEVQLEGDWGGFSPPSSLRNFRIQKREQKEKETIYYN